MTEIAPHIAEFLKDVVGVVEANSCESMFLWERHHVQLKKPWVSNLSGYGVTVGELDDHPVHISLLINTVDGKRILFWHATSMVVDYRMIEAWLEAALPEAYNNRTDAINFSNILSRAN